MNPNPVSYFNYNRVEEVTIGKETSFVYSDCVFVVDVFYSKEDGSLNKLTKGSKWEQITYSCKENKYYLNDSEQEVVGSLCFEEDETVSSLVESFGKIKDLVPDVFKQYDLQLKELRKLKEEVDNLKDDNSVEGHQRLFEIASDKINTSIQSLTKILASASIFF